MASECMKRLETDLKTKCGLNDTTVAAYLKALVELNNNVPLMSLGFLKSTDAMAKLLEPHAPETKQALLTAIVTVLSLTKDAPSFKRVYSHYFRLLNPKKASPPTQTWDDILRVKAFLADGVKPLFELKSLSPEQTEKMLSYLVVSLFTEMIPRRNQDYLAMKVVKKYNPEEHKDDNYLCLSSSKMIFNKFKSRKASGLQTIDVPPSLLEVIQQWLKHNSEWKKNKKSGTPTSLLGLESANALTRILNKTLGKRIGSSYLKSIYPQPKETTMS
jgi:hypothetical protein